MLDFLIDMAADIADIFIDNALNRWLKNRGRKTASKKAEREKNG